MMTKEEAMRFLDENVSNKNMIKHCLASGAVMRGLAIKLGLSVEEQTEWEIAGILHDADVDFSTPENQGAEIGKKLAGQLNEKIIHAMAAHNEGTGVKCESAMDWALYAGEKLTGLIVATTLVLPSKKIADVSAEMVRRRFKEKSFAKGAVRENITEGQRLGLSLEEFIEVSLEAMKTIAKELGL